MAEFTSRPPRIQPELPVGEVQIPTPPNAEGGGRQNLLQIGLPLITIVGYLVMSVSGQGRSLAMMIPMALSMVASVSMALVSFSRSSRQEAEQKEAYAQRLAELRKEMRASHDIQRAFYRHNYPNPDTILRIAADRENREWGMRLWERRTTDSDFVAIRLGVGTRPSSIRYTVGSAQANEDPQMKDALKLQDDSRFVSDVPIIIPLRRFLKDGSGSEDSEKKPEGTPGEQSIPARFALGIVGDNAPKVYEFVRAVMVHYTAFHAPTDARLFVVGTPAAKPNWEWARWLPHCNTSRNQSSTGDQLCFEPDKVRRQWDDLQVELERRQLRLADKDSSGDVTLPHLLVVVDALSVQGDISPLNEVQAEAAVSILLQRGPELGATIVFIVPNRIFVPSDCRAVVELQTPNGALNGETTFRYAEVGINTQRFVGTVDTLDAARAEHDFARKLAPLTVRTTYGADLATAVNLLEMNRKDTVDELPIMDQWYESRKPENAQWLRVPIGLMPGNKLRELVFSADGDGVHGMIAGTTGSGKSELLLTLIVGLALRYDPSVVNFVLVDYKGGAAFDPFRTLPHCVDIVTNLQGTAGVRTFTALRSELNRRSKMIADYNVKHIVHYRQKGLHLTAEPFPFLFVIVDEFAEMVKENPEFKAQLDSITRLGRALGVSLILATQRPAGAVTDQMRANMKFRICLRVETPEDSRELLRRSDAAFLPPNIPGRAYLQVGNENVELMQVARAGGPYTGPQIDAEPPVIWLNRPKQAQPARSGGGFTEAPALSDVIVDIMHRLADDNPEEVALQRKPWPDPLPRRLPLDAEYLPNDTERNPLLPLNRAVSQWLSGHGSWPGIDWAEDAMHASIGLIDNPARAEQLVLRLDLTRGHGVIFGASGWGKTTFLRTVITSLAATHSPAELQIYILDFGGRGLDVLEMLPHRAASITPSEEERVQRLLRRLTGLLEARKSVLSQARADNLGTYNANHPDNIQPAILVVIDNFAEFKENFDGLMDSLISIAREGRAYGVHLLVTAEQTSAMPGKLYSLFTERLTLKLAESTEYAAIVGRGVPGIDDIAGRGFVAVERNPLEFQTALPVAVTAEEEARGLDDTTKLAMLAQMMNNTWTGARPEGIDILRSIIPLRSVLPKLGEGPERIQTILGLEDLDLQPAAFDLQLRGPHFLIIGPPLCGKTTTLRAWTLALAHMYDPANVNLVLIDFQQRFFKYGGKHTLGDLPHVLATVSEAGQLTQVVENLKFEYSQPRQNGSERPEIFIISDNYDDWAQVVGPPTRAKEYAELAELARKFGPEGLHFVMCGSMGIMRAMDDLMKQVVSPRYGLGLDASDAPQALGGRVRASGGNVEYPPGRGYVVKSGRSSLIQVAIPHDESNLEGSLDIWIEEIAACYPDRARWYKELVPPTGESLAGDKQP